MCNVKSYCIVDICSLAKNIFMKILWVCIIYDCLHSKFHMSTVLLNGKLYAVIVRLPRVALQKDKLLNVVYAWKVCPY